MRQPMHEMQIRNGCLLNVHGSFLLSRRKSINNLLLTNRGEKKTNCLIGNDNQDESLFFFINSNSPS